MIDYHIHTKLCGHAKGEISEYIETAERLGLSELGFADHFPLNYQPKFSVPVSAINMKEDEIELYLDMINHSRRHTSSIKIKTGFEVDYYEKDNRFFKEKRALYDELDFVIGSIHFFDEISMDQEEFIKKRNEIGIVNVWKKYFQEMRKLIENHRELIDVIGHFDLPKKFGDRIPTELYDLVDKILVLIKEKELVLEINTSGWYKPVRELYPSIDIIKRAKEHGIEFTIGSDAHSPEEVGRGFQDLMRILENLGINRLITFKHHKKNYFK